jgi:hypothetical protein
MPSTPAILLLLRALLQRACAIGRRRPALATLRTYRYKLDAELDALLRSIPTHTAGDKLQQAIEGCRRFLFTFLANRAIPPTNNGSERALRPCVVFRKVTNCFRSEWAANLYADIRSVIETARRRAIGILDAIRETLNGSPLVEMRALSCQGGMARKGIDAGHGGAKRARHRDNALRRFTLSIRRMLRQLLPRRDVPEAICQNASSYREPRQAERGVACRHAHHHGRLGQQRIFSNPSLSALLKRLGPFITRKTSTSL